MPAPARRWSRARGACWRSASSRSIGCFDRGDVVGIRDVDGVEFARGLTNYGTSEALLIRGQRIDNARQAHGLDAPYDEVVHRDNLVLTR